MKGIKRRAEKKAKVVQLESRSLADRTLLYAASTLFFSPSSSVMIEK